jgi:uncharacterized membrane protein
MSARKVETLDEGANEGAARPASARRKYFYAIAALLSLIGLADSVYLTVEHLAGRSVPCTITGGCEEVLRSAYATVGGIPLAGIGALAYFTAFSLATLSAFGNEKARALLFYLVALMFFVSVWLFVVQAFILKAFCQFCLLSGAVTLALLIIVVLDKRRTRRTARTLPPRQMY